jgi:hypothetical protein
MKKLILMFTVAAFTLSASAFTVKGDDKEKKETAKKECSKDATKSCCKSKDGKDAKACAKSGETKSCHEGDKAAKTETKTSDKK